ncbi:MAG: hypothetical protein DRH44_07355 [Candidatus Coatesbacteria bacterium]|nr:MAG: hypothetical protein DRH44_07355 [Candidatus Coatesbacteria bacterium]
MVILLFSVALCDEWHIITVDYSEHVGICSCIAVDSQDNPHISYYDEYYGNLKYAYYDGTEWHIDTVDYGDTVGEGTSIALDNNDNPHIAYIDYWEIDIKYAYYDGEQWNIEIVDRDGTIGYDVSLALDSNDTPHIAYSTYYPPNILKYAYKDGDEWVIKVIDDETEGGWGVSIALDSEDMPHISHSWGSELRYDYWDGEEWHIETVDEEGRYPSSIAVNSSDFPCIAYAHTYGLKYAHWDGNQWNIDIICGGLVDADRALIIDSDDRPHISFQNNECLEYAYFDGIDWNIEVVDSNGDVGRYAAIGLDSRGNPHISYYDDHPNYHLKYAWYGPDNDITLLSFTADASKPSAVNLRWSISADEGDDILGFNLYRRELKEGAIHKLRIRPKDVGEAPVRENYNSPLQRDNLPEWHKVNSTTITGTNPYSYTDTGVAENTQYEYKLEAVMGGDSGETLGTTTVETGEPASFGIVRLYPNPTSDIVNCVLRVPEPCEVDIAIYDISGREVSEERFSVENAGKTEVFLDISGFVDGVYTITAYLNNECESRRIVVAK